MSWTSMPEELLLEVFGWITTAEDLCSLSLVCKIFNTISSDVSWWIPLCSRLSSFPHGYVFNLSIKISREDKLIQLCSDAKKAYLDSLRNASEMYMKGVPLVSLSNPAN